MFGISSGELAISPGSDGRFTPLPKVSMGCSPRSKPADLLASNSAWRFPNVVTGDPTAWAMSLNGAFFRIKPTTLPNWT